VPLLRRSARAVLEMHHAGDLVPHLRTQFFFTYGHQPGLSQENAWNASLPLLAHDLADAGLAEVEVLVEYQLPLCSLRADVVLAGTRPGRDDVPSYVVVELKQWSEAIAVDNAPDLCTTPHTGDRTYLNPIAQVRRYCEYLVDFTRSLHDRVDPVAGVAYLHNAAKQNVASLYDLEQGQYGRLFTKSDRAALLTYLKSRLAPASGARAADILIHSKAGPSKQLMAWAAEEIKQEQTFVLLDEQQVAYSMVLAALERAQRADQREAVVITGGPGSGKSVIATTALGELFRRGFSAMHATGSKSFTTTMRKVAGKGVTRVQKLFQYFNSFSNTAGASRLDVLICDEAHRIRETSNNRYTPAAKRSQRRQVEELLDAAWVPVFLLDEHQVVRPGEMGTVEEITEAAAAKGIKTHLIDLDGQFRCGGSRKYEQWVKNLLHLDGSAAEPSSWDGDERFELTIADSPAALEAYLANKQQEGYGARITAGFCGPEPAAGERRGHRGLAPAVERERRPRCQRSAPVPALGHRPCRLRPSRLHLHRTRLRIRLERCHLRPRPRLAHRQVGHRPVREQGHSRRSSGTQHVRQADPQYL
jgi:DNA replication protein DnaC